MFFANRWAIDRQLIIKSYPAFRSTKQLAQQSFFFLNRVYSRQFAAKFFRRSQFLPVSQRSAQRTNPRL